MKVPERCYYVVVSPGRLAKVVSELVRQHGPRQLHAAPKIGVATGTLTALRRGQRSRLDPATVAQLERAIYALRDTRQSASKAERITIREDVQRLLEPFWQSLVAPDPGRARREVSYEMWCDERAGRFASRQQETWYLEADGTVRLVPRDEEPAVWRATDAKILRSALMVESGELRAFLRFCDRKGVPQARRDVALMRIMEPLLEAAEAGFIDRHWSQLDEAELRRFVRAGIEREKILLNSHRPR